MLAENAAQLAEKDAQLAENAVQLAQKDAVLAENAVQLAENANQIQSLQAQKAQLADSSGADSFGTGPKLTNAEFLMYVNDFRAADSNGNGSLDLEEVKALLMTQLGRAPSIEEAQQLFDEMNLDNDGRVSLQEYMHKVLGPGWTVHGFESAAAALEAHFPT